MFENISKGEVHLPHFCNTEPNSCNCGFLFIGEDATTIGCLYHNKHEGDVGEEDYPEKDEAIANANFIKFCFTLQQKYDIGLFEEAIKTLEEIKSMCDGNIDKENSIWFECNHILKKLTQNK